jgi:hypothetical protein
MRTPAIQAVQFLADFREFFKPFTDVREQTVGAQERTRTSTPLRAPAPEAGASTNSATWARGRRREVGGGIHLVNAPGQRKSALKREGAGRTQPLRPSDTQPIVLGSAGEGGSAIARPLRRPDECRAKGPEMAPPGRCQRDSSLGKPPSRSHCCRVRQTRFWRRLPVVS